MWLLNTFVLMPTLNPNKYDDFHVHMDYVILCGFTEGKWYDMIGKCRGIILESRVLSTYGGSNLGLYLIIYGKTSSDDVL